MWHVAEHRHWLELTTYKEDESQSIILEKLPLIPCDSESVAHNVST